MQSSLCTLLFARNCATVWENVSVADVTVHWIQPTKDRRVKTVP